MTATPCSAEDCGWWDPLSSCKAAKNGADQLAATMNKAIEALQAELKETRKAALEAVNTATVAIAISGLLTISMGQTRRSVSRQELFCET
jgi:hypothetical protein